MRDSFGDLERNIKLAEKECEKLRETLTEICCKDHFDVIYQTHERPHLATFPN